MDWIRKRIYWIAGILVGGMILWLITSAVTLQSVQKEGTAGTLFGRSVSEADYLRSLQAVTHQAILTYGDRLRQSVTEKELEAQAWERLSFTQEAKRKGIRVTDQEVIQTIQEIPLFKNNGGQFDSQGYNVVMQYTLGTTPRLFEEEVRENLLIQKLIQQVIGKPTASEKEIRERFQEREGAIQVEFASFPDPLVAREVADACHALPRQLEKAAAQAGSKVETTPYFKRTDKVENLDSSAAVFGQMTELQPGETAGPFKAGTGWVVARLKGRNPPEEKDFAGIRADLEKEIISQKRFHNYLVWYQELTQRAKPEKKNPRLNVWPPAPSD